MRGSTAIPFPYCESRAQSKLPIPMPASQVNDEALQFHWKTFPAEAKDFFHTTLDSLSLIKLVEFWGAHSNYLVGSVSGGIYGASWYLALVYMNRNELAIARSLTLNGSFLQQCYHSSFDQISDMCARGDKISEVQLPYFCAGFDAIRSSYAMYSFLTRMLPREYQQMLASFCNMGSKNRMMNFVGNVDQDWQERNSLKSSLSHSIQSNSSDDTMTLVIGDDSFQACPSKPLKAIFNDYADKNSVSLKTLRFSYAGKTLFLSTVGKKSPDELGMTDNDSIEVHSAEVAAPSNETQESHEAKKKSVTKKHKKARGKSKKPKKDTYRLKVVKSDEEHKEDHSLMLTKLFEEANPRFKVIRQQLDALNLFKQQPKTKVQTKTLSQICPCSKSNPTSEGVGGKAGKTHFVVNVGEVSNLYKSSKSIHNVSSPSSSIIDLHGCSRAEAIFRLNAGLDNWNKQAMTGSYPFIHSVSIICGAGSQILSEVVEKWIAEKPNVCNAPKAKIARCRFASAA